MPRLLRVTSLLVAVIVVASGCSVTNLLQRPTPGPSDSPAPIVTPGPPASAPATLPPRLTPAPTATPRATATPEVTAPPATATPVPATPKPTATPRPPLAVKILAVGDRVDGTAPDADVARLVASQTDFAIDLLGRVVRTAKEPNVVLGPASIVDAFTLLLTGAEGETADQIEAALSLDLPPNRLNQAIATLDQALTSRENRKVTLNIVNQLFGQAGYPFRRGFLSKATRFFGAPLATVDFTRNPRNVARVINAWIADQTNDRIKDVLNPAQLSPATRLILVNATYLKAEWAQKFEKVFTERRTFHRPDGSTVKVPTMSQSGRFPAAFTDGTTALELPYVGGDLAMLIVMPDDPEAFLRTLDAKALARIVAGLKTDFTVQGVPFPYIDVLMPRFSSRTKVPLKPVLQKMGMRDVWIPGTADLTGIADPTETGEAPLNAGGATHEAWVKVTEKGTEAAAVTLIDIGTGGGPEVPPPLAQIDHPFYWFIRDRETGAILFTGYVTDPSVTAE
jgi:serpin B